MKKKILVAFLLLAFCFSLLNLTSYSNTTIKQLKVHFIDVGQGDAILIQTPIGKSILIDSGPNTAEKQLISYIDSLKIKNIDVVIATHPHEDHIGNMDKVISSYKIGKVYMPNKTTNTKTFESMLLAIKEKNLKINIPDVNDNISPDSKIKMIVLSPNKKASFEDINDYSIVLKVEYGKTGLLLTGDATSNIEEKLLHDSELKQYLKSDVLKVAHHGSKYSSTSTFLSTVKPRYSVISVGKGNDYGHPAAKTLNKLKSIGTTIYRTDESGTIIVTSDGNTIKIDKKASSIKPQAPPSSKSSSKSITSKSNKSNDDNIIVYVTKTGHKYHRDGCRYLRKSQIPMTFKEAKEAGYEPCNVCDPPK